MQTAKHPDFAFFEGRREHAETKPIHALAVWQFINIIALRSGYGCVLGYVARPQPLNGVAYG